MGTRLTKEERKEIREDQKAIIIDGAEVVVDKDFISLLSELNRVGLRTTQHCAGHAPDHEAYLSIDITNCNVEIRETEKKGHKRIVLFWSRK